MKTRFTILAVLLTAFFFTNAQVYQVPNAEFQTWPGTDSSTAPTGWCTFESIYHAYLTGTYAGLATKDTSDKIVGAWSIRLETKMIPIEPNVKIPGTVSLGTGDVSFTGAPPLHGIPFAYRPDTAWLAYKYTTVNNAVDTPVWAIVMTNAGVPVFASNYIITDSTNTNSWQFNYAVLTDNYFSNNNPDTLSIILASSSDSASTALGSVLHVNAMFFSYVTLPTGLQELSDKLNISVYPNPASNVLNVATQSEPAGCQILISDLNGKLVSLNTLQGTKSAIDIHNLASGTYLYRVADKQGNIFKQDKFIVVK